MSRIPIIGMGAVSAAGHCASKGYDAVVAGKDCLTPLSLFDAALKAVPLCGQVPDDPEPGYSSGGPNRCAGLALRAIREALQPMPERNGLRLGMVLATTVAGMTRSEQFYRALRDDPGYLEHAARELACHEPTAIAGFLARQINAQGFHSISTACSTSLHALGMAKRLIEHDRYDLCLAVGVDALSILTVRGFASLMLLDFSGCKPFDARRVGISLGEGAGALLLASAKAARQSGIEPVAAVAGWGASADGHHMTAPHPDGEGAVRATTAALEEADIAASAIDMIAAHGTGTPDNDIAEIRAMRTLFDPLPPFCSMKRTLGHTLAASGILETVFAIHALHDNRIPATAGFEQPDEAINAQPSPGEEKIIHHFIKNSFGFGGNNASVVISKWEWSKQ